MVARVQNGAELECTRRFHAIKVGRLPRLDRKYGELHDRAASEEREREE
jgi:hypothetical protein